MNSIKTQTIDHVRPIAPRRSSRNVFKDSSLNEVERRSNPSLNFSEINHYNNIEERKDDTSSTKIQINTLPHVRAIQTKHIKLVISNDNPANSSYFDYDSYLSTLVNEYQAGLNRKDCDEPSCYRFKLLSYRISQTLFERINSLKNDLQVNKTTSSGVSKVPVRRQTSLQPSCKANNLFSEFIDMDKDSLIVEQNKRIQDLERLLEDQRRLRLQDASQVEEKAARIKEWVANKLKELENQNKLLRDQNKLLRDQNRKQKEAVESLSNKLATMSPISSPKRTDVSTDNINFIDHSQSTNNVIDQEIPLQARNTKFKKSLQLASSSSEDENHNHISKLNLSSQSPVQNRSASRANDKVESIYDTSDCLDCPEPKSVSISSNNIEGVRRSSPVYDSVSADDLTRRTIKSKLVIEPTDDQPPPPPLHQSDRWELQLYNLVDQTLSSIIKQNDDEKLTDSSTHLDSIESTSNSDKDISISRKSSSSLKNDLISIVKPLFTTIDGDSVIDNSDMELRTLNLGPQGENRDSMKRSNQPERYIRNRDDSIDSQDNIDQPRIPNLFDSPMRSRSRKDNILRTQSVRKNPAPEKLYDFIVADLIKRGNLVKSGTLKNYTRWFVLKNFTLYSYKCDSEETTKSTPSAQHKLSPSCQVYAINPSNESSFPFKLVFPDKILHLAAESVKIRDEWIRILTVTINMSDIKPDTLTKANATYEGIMNVTRHGHTKRYYAMLISHVLFFLKSLTDPNPMSYMSMRGSRIREITDNCDYDMEEQDALKHQTNNIQDCSLAIYPKYSLTSDPVYITLGTQQDTDKWFSMLAKASGLDQSYGTLFERTLASIMINNSITTKMNMTNSLVNSPGGSSCHWKNHTIMVYSDRPIDQPLTSLPNETLRTEAIELFKSVLLFTQVPLTPVAIDYHVCLLQNCLGRFLKYPELRNEFYAQLIKQCTYIHHRCNSSKSSTGSSEGSLTDQREIANSLSTSSSECQFLTDIHMLDSPSNNDILETDSSLLQSTDFKDRTESLVHKTPPSKSELLQVMQILAVAVSLNLPRGRMRWWLMDHLRKFANPHTDIGKYALYTLRAIDRTLEKGLRDSTPSRMEIMSILLRNPHDHSKPHSLPVSFSDGSYLVVEADGSTTIEELICSMAKDIDIRDSLISDFYIFADDPSGSKELHILEPQRKVLDIVGWWEQAFRRDNSGHFQNTKVIKLICKKRLVLRKEDGETSQERLLIVHQLNQEVLSQKIPLCDLLIVELTAIMAQLTFGDFDKSKDSKVVKCMLDKVSTCFLANKSHQLTNQQNNSDQILDAQLVARWQRLSGRSAQDCIRVYLNCIRRLKLDQQ